MLLFSRLPKPLRFIILVYLCGMLLFSIFRIILVLMHFSEASSAGTGILLQALFMGLRFDAVINGYLLALPLLVFFFFSFSDKYESAPAGMLMVFISVVYPLAIFIHCADLPWFSHSQTRLTAAALAWTDTPGMMLKIIFEDVYNYPFLVLLILLVVLFIRLVRKLKNRAWKSEGSLSRSGTIAFYLFAMLLMFAGIRGRVAIKSPIRWGTAFFSASNFANQLGLNPVYTFMRSWLDKKDSNPVVYHFMDDDKAVSAVREQLGAVHYADSVSPVARPVTAHGAPKGFNVVLILMEGMSAKNMRQFGNENALTPSLDSLFNRSLSFTDFYSDGVHTHNGIFTSLYGYHTLPMMHHMKDLEHSQSYSGLPGLLSRSGYHTMFFTTHDEQFDNMAGFLLPNGFQKIISEKDFPGGQVLSTLGVPDHILFEGAIEEIGKLPHRKPFFIAMITGSNHGPYVFPENIPLKTKSADLKDQLIEYSDWAIGVFMMNASLQPWFDSTVFVFTGDHGALTSGFDRYLAFHHVPFMIYAPAIFSEPVKYSSVGGQADIFPTVAGLLNLSYTNNSMGVDLLKQKRAYYPFNNDEEMCCVSNEFLFTMQQGHETLYKISEDKKSLSPSPPGAVSDSMKYFTEAVLQVTRKMLSDNKMGNRTRLP